MVPNQFPTIASNSHRLAIIGEAPGQDEETIGKPFVGSSGKLLRAVLGSNNISPDQCFIGNVCQIRPPDNDISEFDFEGTEIQSGLARLLSDLDTYKPNSLLLLGKTAFRAFRPDLCYEVRVTKANPDGYYIPLGNWRGSVAKTTVGSCWKAVATFHPAYILRAYGDIPYFKWDVNRAVKHSRSPELRYLERSINIRPSIDDVLRYLTDIEVNERAFSTDIEGYADNVGVTMLSLAPTPTDCIVIPFWINGDHYWNEEEEIMVWSALHRIYLNPRIRKKTHNGFYELFVLGWRHRMVIRNIDEDTMLKEFELFPELEKSLAVSTSFHTEEPYYKDDRESTDVTKRLIYNGKDSCCTEEVERVQEPMLRKQPRGYEHYRFNIRLMPAFHYMHLRGCRFDMGRAQQHRQKAEAELKPLLAELESAAGRPINPKSTDDKKWLLYEHLKYPIHKRYGASTKEPVIHRLWAKDRNPLLRSLVRAINLRTRISDIGKLTCNDDGRIRCSYDLSGAGTSRLNSRESLAMYAYLTKKGLIKWDYTGTNLQNQTKDLRDCFLADSPDFDFFQFDLSGADAWTVAADLAALGHETMLEDLKYGLKPSKILLLMLQYLQEKKPVSDINRMDRATLKAATKHLGNDDTDKFKYPNNLEPDKMYLCMKRVQHGTNYVAKPETVSETIFKDTDGEIDLHPRDAATYQALYKIRYSVDARTDYIRRTLQSTNRIQTAIGFSRQFYAIRPGPVEDDIVRSAASLEPQANTTGVTNRALEKLWYDQQNHRKDGSLFVEPILQIHDALAGQYPVKLREWAREKFKNWFDNPIVVHGIEVRIPAEGNYGPDWKNAKTPLN
jgi:uracil-DNA glycosylase family 4